MVDHKIPLMKVRAHMLYRVGEVELRRAYQTAMAQEFSRQEIPVPSNLILRTWAAGCCFARGIQLGGSAPALSEPCHA